jgi:hypothetical protein
MNGGFRDAWKFIVVKTDNGRRIAMQPANLTQLGVTIHKVADIMRERNRLYRQQNAEQQQF